MEVISQAITTLCGQSLIKVYLNPADKQQLHADEQGQLLFGRHANVEWMTDEHVSPGDCLIESAQGSLDVRLADQLEQLRTLWLEVARKVADNSAGISA
jgi:flagellar assembly protein FliH